MIHPTGSFGKGVNFTWRRREDSLARQNRLFGGVYASIAIATALLLFTR